MSKRHDILVLNRGYIPIHIVDWQTGMSLIFTEKCRALDRDFLPYTFTDWLAFSVKNGEDYGKVHSVNYAVAIPEIVVSTTFDKLPDRKVKYSRQNVFSRDKNKCGYCAKQFPTKDLTVDHIIPRDRGGVTTWDNVVACCFPCNQRKSNKTPAEAGMVLKRKPVRPRWVSPLSNYHPEKHPCRSWQHFASRIGITVESKAANGEE